jgi:hypothetical protein
MRQMADGSHVQSLETETLGLAAFHDWPTIDRLEAAGETVDIDDHITLVEEVATGMLRPPTPDEVRQLRALREKSAEVVVV